MRMLPPRSGPGRSLALIAVTALLLLPTVSVGGNQSKDLRNALRAITTNYDFLVRDIQAETRYQLRMIPRTTSVGNFDSTLAFIAGLGYTAWYLEKEAYYDGLDQAKVILGGTTIDYEDPSFLLGRGSCADSAREQYLWGERLDYLKWLEATLRGPRWNLEQYNPITERFDRIPVLMSVRTFPNPRDTLIFTASMMGGGGRVSIAGIVAASYTLPGNSSADGSACAFGRAEDNATVDVTVDGPGGSFVNSTTADSEGRWNVCVTGLTHGYYQYLADSDGKSATPREFGLQLKLQF